ncbi:MAG TPA: serine hydrolase domain-containing protein [Candidatus Wallbacteria bacterium]|nr:serine hydrolase domain-containing protein [Candidatus Wallbacteria bacterium]
MKKLTLILLVLFMIVSLATASEAKKKHHRHGECDRDIYKNAIGKARDIMWNGITNGHGTGVTLAFTDKGRIVHAEGIGVADRSENRPVDLNTRFNIGSTSKMFAAVAILLLVDDGIIALDDSVAKYIPEFKMPDPRYKDITVRMLFNHSSGLPGSTFYFGYETDDKMHKYLLDTLAGSYLKHKPGAMAIYCNDGFTLAEIVVERVSGKKFVEFLAERVFKPLGMKNTGASVGEIQNANTAEYYDAKTGKKHPREVVMVYGAGGLSSTASDLCIFANSFSPYGKHILSEASIREILRTQPNEFSNKLKGPQICSDFGWDYSNLPDFEKKGFQVLAKSGGTGCYNTYIQTVPKYGITVVFSISGSGSNLEAMSRPILDAVMECANVAKPEEKPVVKPVEGQDIPKELFGYEGYYMSGDKVVKARLDKEKKTCALIPVGGPKTAAGKDAAPIMSLTYNNGCFHLSEKNLKMYFTTDGGESYMAIHELPNYGSDAIAYQKIKELKDPKALKIDINGKTWLMRNAPFHILVSGIGLLTSSVYEELPGYVDFGGLKKVECPHYAGIANNAFRDQAALSLFDRDGKVWAKSGCFIYSMADNTRTAMAGTNKLFIKPEGFNEWLRIEKGAVLGFEKPAKGRIMVFSGESQIYDSVEDSKEIYAPAGSFVFCGGKAGDVFKIEVK